MKIKKFVFPFGILFLYIALSNLESIIFYYSKTGLMIKDNAYLILLSGITFGTIIFLTRKKWTGEWNNFKKNKKQYIPLAIKYWVMGFIYMFISNLLINTVILKNISPNEAANREILNAYRYYAIISTAIFAPIIEETIFRLDFKGLFKTKNSFIFFTGILFGAMHLFASTSLIELIYIIPYSCLGIAFSKIYAETDNIIPSIMMHIIHNSLTLFIILGGL